MTIESRIGTEGGPIAARPDSHSAIDDFLLEHGSDVLRVARRFSASSSDAEDAYQRAFEKLLTRPPESTDDGDVLPWLLTVVRNEALMIRRTSRRLAPVPFEDVAEGWVADGSSPADRVVELEALDVGREALLRINPDQARCLLLRADGLSYEEISDETGFTYAKVHRALTEGRRVYRGLLGRIESGAECRRLEPLISLQVDGELDLTQRRDLELHLENCSNCRAAMRDYALAPRELAALFPVGAAVTEGQGVVSQIADQLSSVAAWFNERLFSQAAGGQAAEMALAKKIALATAVTASVVAGGTTIERFADSDRPAADPIKAIEQLEIQSPVTGATGDRTQESGREAQPAKAEKTRRPREATEADVVESQAESAPPSSASPPADRPDRSPAADPPQIIDLPENTDIEPIPDGEGSP